MQRDSKQKNRINTSHLIIADRTKMSINVTFYVSGCEIETNNTKLNKLSLLFCLFYSNEKRKKKETSMIKL